MTLSQRYALYRSLLKFGKEGFRKLRAVYTSEVNSVTRQVDIS